MEVSTDVRYIHSWGCQENMYDMDIPYASRIFSRITHIRGAQVHMLINNGGKGLGNTSPLSHSNWKFKSETGNIRRIMRSQLKGIGQSPDCVVGERVWPTGWGSVPWSATGTLYFWGDNLCLVCDGAAACRRAYAMLCHAMEAKRKQATGSPLAFWQRAEDLDFSSLP